MEIAFVEDAAAIARCYPLMATLRPRLSREDFLSAVPRMAAEQGYRLVCLEDEGVPRGLAGIRIGEWLHTGRYLEIEDLVVAEGQRSKGYGRALLHWVAGHARRQGCRQLRLVSGVKRTDAHRFYEREAMIFEAKYFSMDLA